MNIVFMGTPDFSLPTLQKLHQSRHQVSAVVTQPDRPKGRGRELSPPPVKQFALQEHLDIHQPAKASAPEFVGTLREYGPDMIIVVAYGQILKQAILDLPAQFCMNLHASLLPKYRGAAPINRAIIDGETETGVTTMKMDAGLDTGDMLLRRAVPIKDSDTSQTLHDLLAELGGDLVLETLDQLEAGTLESVPQDSSQATYAPKLKKEDGRIPWNQSARQIHNLVRGLEPWPGAFLYYRSKRIRVCTTEVTGGVPEDRPGTIARVSDYGIEVGTTEGRLIITELQPEGKKRMTVKSFLAGHTFQPGDAFDTDAHLPISNPA